MPLPRDGEEADCGAVGQDARRHLLALERERCAALVARDTAALAALLADDLVHIHGTGEVEGKAAYLEGVARKYKFHMVERGDLAIRLYGDMAVMTGPLRQRISISGRDGPIDVAAIVTQVWSRSGGQWRQNTCHNAFLATS